MGKSSYLFSSLLPSASFNYAFTCSFQKRIEEVVRTLSSILHTLMLVSLIIITFGWSYSSLVLQVCLALLM